MQKIYRKSVGCVLLNKDNLVFIAKRIGTTFNNAWQMPQGGVDQDETLEQTLFRELLEEIGTNNISILSKTNTLFYDFPENIAQKLADDFGSYYVGQEQIWFFCRFLGSDDEFNFNTTQHPEFTEFEWVTMETAMERCVDFKKSLYKEIFAQGKFLQLL